MCQLRWFSLAFTLSLSGCHLIFGYHLQRGEQNESPADGAHTDAAQGRDHTVAHEAAVVTDGLASDAAPQDRGNTIPELWTVDSLLSYDVGPVAKRLVNGPCNPATETLVGGGVDCGANAIEASYPQMAMNTQGWQGGCLTGTQQVVTSICLNRRLTIKGSSDTSKGVSSAQVGCGPFGQRLSGGCRCEKGFALQEVAPVNNGIRCTCSAAGNHSAYVLCDENSVLALQEIEKVDTSNTVIVSCPNGKLSLGGTCTINQAIGSNDISRAAPDQSGNWQCTYYSLGTYSGISATVMCGTLP